MQLPEVAIKQEEQVAKPAAKKQRTLDPFVAKGNKKDEFLKDLAVAFGTCNIPFEKLKKLEDGSSTLMRQFLDKYIRLDGFGMMTGHKCIHIPRP